VLYPGQRFESTIEVEYVKLLTQHVDFELAYDIDSQLPPEDIDLALGIAELVLLSRFRTVSTIKSKLTNLIKLLQQRGVKI
jgi:hypothetical protein